MRRIRMVSREKPDLFFSLPVNYTSVFVGGKIPVITCIPTAVSTRMSQCTFPTCRFPGAFVKIIGLVGHM